jgi:hypothetical protein
MQLFIKYSIRFFWVLGIIPIFLYFKNLFTYSQNIPHWDDYALIGFVNKYNATEGISAKISLLCAQHNEHRIAFTRLISLLIYNITGSLNFQWLQYFGSIALLAMLYLFYLVLKRNALSVNYLVPICFILFQLATYENTYWGMASVQNFWVVLFVMLCFWQFSFNKIPYLWAALAAFTSANGVLFTPFVGVFVFLFTKNYTALLKYSLYSIALVVLYFGFYHQPPGNEPITIDLANNLKAAFVSFGSVFDVDIAKPIEGRIRKGLIWGLLLGFSYFLMLIIKYFEVTHLKFKLKNNFIFLTAIFLFVAGTCLLTSITRFQYGMPVYLSSKYKIYSLIAFTGFYLITLLNLRSLARQIVLFVFSIISIYLFSINYFYSLPIIKSYYNAEQVIFYNGWHEGKGVLKNDVSSCYQYQKSIFDLPIADDSTQKEIKLDNVEIKDNNIFLSSKNYEINASMASNGAYLEFVSASNKYIFPTVQVTLNNKKGYFLKGKSFYAKGFTSQISLTEIATGDYFVNILSKNNAGLKRILTNYYVEIEGVAPKKVIQNW